VGGDSGNDDGDDDDDTIVATMAAGLIGNKGSRAFWPVELQPPPLQLFSRRSATSDSAGQAQGQGQGQGHGHGQGQRWQIEELVRQMDIDHSVGRIEDTAGGSSAGYRRWRRWLESSGAGNAFFGATAVMLEMMFCAKTGSGQTYVGKVEGKETRRFPQASKRTRSAETMRLTPVVRKTASFLSFPCVCPEPVLAK
jgi:hypothetical protein